MRAPLRNRKNIAKNGGRKMKMYNELLKKISEHKKMETVDYDLLSEKLTWLVRQIDGSSNIDAINVVGKNRAHFFQSCQTTKINFKNVNDLLEKIICQIEKTRKY